MAAGGHITRSEELTWLRSRVLDLERQSVTLSFSDLFDSFLSHSLLIGWIKDEQGRYVYANRELERLAGRMGVDCIGSTDHDLWPRALADRLRAADEKCLKTGAGDSSEVLPTPEGDRTVRIRLFPFRDESGRPYTGGLALEAAEIPAGHMQTLPQRLFQCGLIGIMACSGDTIVDANDTFLGWLGLSRDEVAHGLINWRDLTPARYRARDDEALAELCSTGSSKSYEKEFLDWQGKPVPVETCGVASKAGSEDFTCFVLSLADRKELEARLLRSQKLESLGLIAGGVAHDFNNLLTTILGNAGAALDAVQIDHPAFRPLTELVNASRVASELTQQVLAYSGHAQSVIRTVDLSTAVDEIGSLLGTTISKKINLRFNLAGGLPFIDADEGQIQQVIMNLVINASDAIGERAGEIVVNSREASSGEVGGAEFGRGVCLEVRDTGCGMDAAIKSRIFDPFFTTKANGRGIGLAAVQEIVRGHRGKLWVQSEPGMGTTFQVVFPASEVSPIPRTTVSARPDLRGDETILVVDDDEGIRRVICTAMQRLGYRVLLAAHGEEAVRIFEERHDEIAVVLLDWAMPVMNGDEALKRMMEIDPAATVVMTSGYAQTQTVERMGAGSPLAGFAQKPYTMTQIAERLSEIIVRRRTQRAEASRGEAHSTQSSAPPT
jgi:nitrogen-specific signal transduction histidine kinase/FixJ family two-component response regulator